MKPGHWAIRGNEIVAFVRVASEWQPIATVNEGYERPVRQMLRYTKLAEDIERIADQMMVNYLIRGEGAITREEAENFLVKQGISYITPEQAAARIYELFLECIKDTGQRNCGEKINAPEVRTKRS